MYVVAVPGVLAVPGEISISEMTQGLVDLLGCGWDWLGWMD